MLYSDEKRSQKKKIPSPVAMNESACPGDKTTSSFMPSTYVPQKNLKKRKEKNSYKIY